MKLHSPKLWGRQVNLSYTQSSWSHQGLSTNEDNLAHNIQNTERPRQQFLPETLCRGTFFCWSTPSKFVSLVHAHSVQTEQNQVSIHYLVPPTHSLFTSLRQMVIGSQFLFTPACLDQICGDDFQGCKGIFISFEHVHWQGSLLSYLRWLLQDLSLATSEQC